MSVIGVHIHFHDGELAKFAAYLVDGYFAAMQCVSSKVTSKGNYEKYERLYLHAVKNMALMKKYITPEQKAEIKISLFTVMDKQTALNDENAGLSKKARLAAYKRAVEKFDGLIKSTSSAIVGDLGFNGGDTDAYRMALACTSANIDTMRMMNEIMGLFDSVDASEGKVNPPNAPQPAPKTPQPPKECKPSKDTKRGKDEKDIKHEKEPKPSTGKHRPRKGKHQAVVDPVPVLTAAMTNRLMEVTLS